MSLKTRTRDAVATAPPPDHDEQPDAARQARPALPYNGTNGSNGAHAAAEEPVVKVEAAGPAPAGYTTPDEGRLVLAVFCYEGQDSLVGRDAARLAAAQARRGHAVHLFTRLPFEKVPGVHLHATGECEGDDLLERVAEYSRRASNLFLRHFPNGCGRVTLLGHEWSAVPTLSLLRGLKNLDVVLSLRSLERQRSDMSGALSKKIEEQELTGLREARVVLTHDAATAEVAKYWEPGCAERIVPARSPFPVEDFRTVTDPGQVKARYQVGPVDPMVVYLGDMNQRYGPDLLVKAMPAVLKNHPQARLVVAGDGDLFWPVRVYTRYLLLEHAVRQPGSVEGKASHELLQAADVVVVPSREPTPWWPVLAAWAAGRPVVATHNAAPGLLEHEQDAVLCYPNENSLVWGVERVLYDADLCARMAEKGAAKLEERFGWNSVAAQVEALIGAAAGSPVLPPTTRTPCQRGQLMPNGYLMLVLHAHLPYVRHPEYDRFLEERWFFEAVTETYIPLIKFFDRLHAEGKPFKLTLSISPTLANMMEDPLLRERCVRHLDLLLRLAECECERTKNWPDVHFLAQMYRRLFEEARVTFVERCRTRLVSAFRQLADAGHLELITCAGTHGYLPLLSSEPGAVRAQVFTAVQEHERIFGRKPKGMWVPECAFYPGLDEVLAQAGIRYFFTDTHGIDCADPRPLFGVAAPVYTPAGVAAFGRHPMTSKLVWCTSAGYPADPAYREYYRDIGFDLEQDYLAPFQYAPGIRTHTGIKYHRITGKTQDKHLYNPDGASQAAQRHAQDFVRRCRDHAAGSAGRMPLPSAIVSPYDAELFGHWWFEGPQWVYHVLRELSAGGELELATPGQYLRDHPIQQKAMPAPSSWGRNGYNEHWVNAKTDWMWRPLHEASARMRQAVRARPGLPHDGPEDRTLRQAGRELLLAQASDWPFIITNGTTEEYARRRFHDHVNRCHDLLHDLDQRQIDPGKLEALEYMDALFPKLDYRLFASA